MHVDTWGPEQSEQHLCHRHSEAYFSQFSDEVVDSILKHEGSSCSTFVGRPDAKVVSVDGCRNADGFPRARQRKEAGQGDIEE